jgi:CheY-like chemotaxis protein
MEAKATGSPYEALEWIRGGEDFDVAILDVQMPEMDGLTLAAEIRRERSARELPLIMATSLGLREAHSELELAAFLVKPIKPAQLYQVLLGVFTADHPLVARGAAGEQFDPEMGRRHPLRILLAEDNATNQRLALRLLGRMGYRADVAANGIEVLQALRRQPYDVVLMDVQMPEMDGLEATREVAREWPPEQRPRVVAMTAGALKEDRDQCLAAGMEDYVSKPIRVDELVRALSECRPEVTEGRACSPASEPAPECDETGQAGSVLDPVRLDTLLRTVGDPSFLAELIGTFLEDAPTLLAKMRRAVEDGDAAALRLAAHSLKSNSADFGAKKLAEVCLGLEEMGRDESLDQAATELAMAEAEFPRVRQALAAARAGFEDHA